MYAFLKGLVPPKIEFVASDETYFTSEKFPNVDNLFAEELKLGNFAPYRKKGDIPIEIKIYHIPSYNECEGIAEIPVEELTEEVPDYLPEPDFSMTGFGDNLSETVPELQEEKVIVENEGVYSITEDLPNVDVAQNKDFKNLVDSVLL